MSSKMDEINQEIINLRCKSMELSEKISFLKARNMASSLVELRFHRLTIDNTIRSLEKERLKGDKRGVTIINMN